MLNVINNILKTNTYGEGGGNPSQPGPSGGEGGGNPEPPRGPRPPYHYAGNGNNPEGDKEKKVRKSAQKRTKEALEASLQKYRDENPYPMTPGQSMEEYNLSTKRKEAKLYTLANKREAITGNRDKKIYSRSTIEIAKSREEVKLRLPQKANETSEEYEKRIIDTEFSLTHNKIAREKKGIQPKPISAAPRRLKEEVKLDRENLQKENPKRDFETSDEYEKRIANLDLRNNYSSNKERKLFEESTEMKFRDRRTKVEIEKAREELKKQVPPKPGQSQEDYDKHIAQKDRHRTNYLKSKNNKINEGEAKQSEK